MAFLLEDIGRIAHVDVHEDIVGRAAGLRLKAETDPTMRIVGPGEVARGDVSTKEKTESAARASFLIG